MTPQGGVKGEGSARSRRRHQQKTSPTDANKVKTPASSGKKQAKKKRIQSSSKKKKKKSTDRHSTNVRRC